jgi:NAD(P)-dependent dehydrogenase (short-subunit alcohol dehydrogenase family)
MATSDTPTTKSRTRTPENPRLSQAPNSSVRRRPFVPKLNVPLPADASTPAEAGRPSPPWRKPAALDLAVHREAPQPARWDPLGDVAPTLHAPTPQSTSSFDQTHVVPTAEPSSASSAASESPAAHDRDICPLLARSGSSDLTNDLDHDTAAAILAALRESNDSTARAAMAQHLTPPRRLCPAAIAQSIATPPEPALNSAANSTAGASISQPLRDRIRNGSSSARSRRHSISSAAATSHDTLDGIIIEKHCHSVTSPIPESNHAHDGSCIHHRRQRGYRSKFEALLPHSENVAFLLLCAQLIGYALLLWWCWPLRVTPALAVFVLVLLSSSYHLQRFVASGFGRRALTSRFAQRELPGRTAIITGGNSGIGFETARTLLEHGCDVIIACRNADRGRDAVQRLERSVAESPRHRGKVEFRYLDLSRQAIVREFVQQLPADRPVDILVNNAGFTASGHSLTEDGVESVLAVNTVSPFLLTELLIPRLKRGFDGRGGRVINLSSCAHVIMTTLMNSPANFEPADVGPSSDAAATNRRQVAATLEHSCKAKGPGVSHPKSGYYGLAKLCAVLHAEYLARRHGIRAFAVHPGGVLTSFIDELPFFVRTPIKALNVLVFKTPNEGAQTALQCILGPNPERALEPSVPNGSNYTVRGGYYADCRLADQCRHPKTIDVEEMDCYVNWTKGRCL